MRYTVTESTNQKSCSHEHQHEPPPRFRISSPHNSSITIPLSPSITPAPIFPRTLQELQRSGLWGVSPLHQHQPKEVTITWRFWNVTNITTTNKNNDYNVVFINNVYNKASAMHTHGWFFFLPPPPPPPYPTLLLYRGITTNESHSISMFLSLRKWSTYHWILVVACCSLVP